MTLMQRLSSKGFFVFNLVLIGIIFGFSLALLSFSCSTPGSGNVAHAQESASLSGVSRDSLAVAEGLQSAFNAVADSMLPSVVEVTNVSVQRQRTQSFNGIPWEFFFGPRNEGGGDESQEREYRSRSMGTGIIVRLEGDLYYVLTNNHVVDGSTELLVRTREGKEYPAELKGKDSRRDLAVISFSTKDKYPIARLGDSDNVKVGDWAIAMGNPLGEQFAFSVTMGIISAVGRTGGPGGNINDFIQTDASINQGNSGGPLVNIRGEVVGINTWIATTAGAGSGSVGLGFAIPINNAKRAMEEIIASGSVSDGWLGVSLIDSESEPGREMLASIGIEGTRGALAAQVFTGSPADKGGIRPGDFITHVDKKEVRGTNHLTQMVSDIKPGDRGVFTVIRDGTAQDFTVTIETRTDAVAAENKNLWPGIMVLPLTDSLRTSLKLDRSAEGLYVFQVADGSPADVIGISRGDRISAVNDTPVRDLASFYKALREKTSRELWFTFIRGESTLDTPRVRR